MQVKISHLENPRVEKEKHYYKADHTKLKELGFIPTRNIDDELEIMIDDLINYKERISEKKQSIIKDLKWKN